MIGILLFSFLLGSIPFGYLIGRFKGIDVKESGSGNIGATNVSRVLGKKYGLVVLVPDALKGAIPVFLLGYLGYPLTVRILSGILAILGHCFSPFMGFKGGKGVATSLGVFIIVSPEATFLSLLLFLAVVLLTRFVSLGSIISSLFFPLFFYFSCSKNVLDLTLVIFGSLVVILRHRSNIVRLLKGEEKRFF